MPSPRPQNRSMFWRIVRRLLTAHRGRLVVILLALGAGAAVTAALLNLQVDARRRLTTDFRAFGSNVLVTPRSESQRASQTLPSSLVQNVRRASPAVDTTAVGFLYSVAHVRVRSVRGEKQAASSGTSPVVLVGYSSPAFLELLPHRVVNQSLTSAANAQTATCYAGATAAAKLHLQPGDVLALDSSDDCGLAEIDSFGGPEDNQLFVNLAVAQDVARLPDAISLVQVRVPGTSDQVGKAAAAIQSEIPFAEVRPIRQFTEAQARIYQRISGLLNATVALVLLLTGLCVLASMTNVAMERKNDVGLMKAIGGASRRVMRLFLAEAAILGLIGGLVGAAAGVLLSIWLGKAVFGLAARPRLIVYPVSVALTLAVAIASSFPLRRLARVRPASVFRGIE
jgi:putative ABC transport system permease protein